MTRITHGLLFSSSVANCKYPHMLFSSCLRSAWQDMVF